jgi:hypothetical protein
MKFKLDIDAPCTTAPRRKSFCTLPFFSLLENSHLPPSFYRSIKRGSSFRTHLRKVHGFMPDNFNIGDCSEPLMGNYEEFSPDTSASSCYSTPPSRVGPELLPYRDSPVPENFDRCESPSRDAPPYKWLDAQGGMDAEFYETKPVLMNSLDHTSPVSPTISPLSLSPYHTPPALAYPPDTPPMLYYPSSSVSPEQNNYSRSSSGFASSPVLPPSQPPPYLQHDPFPAPLGYDMPEQLYPEVDCAGFFNPIPYSMPAHFWPGMWDTSSIYHNTDDLGPDPFPEHFMGPFGSSYELYPDMASPSRKPC